MKWKVDRPIMFTYNPVKVIGWVFRFIVITEPMHPYHKLQKTSKLQPQSCNMLKKLNCQILALHPVISLFILQLILHRGAVLQRLGLRLTFFTGLWVGTALNAVDSSPMVISLFLLTVMAEYFSATFSLSFTSLLACFTSNFASPASSDMSTVAVRRQSVPVDRNTTAEPLL